MPSRMWCAASSNDDIVHVSGKVDPISDIDVIDTELGLADLASVEKAVDRAAKAAKARRQGSRAHAVICCSGCAST